MRISDWSSDVCSSDLEDYLDCFQSYSARTQAADEMATLYEDVPDAGERLRLIGVIGSPNVNFTEDDDDEAFEDEPDPFHEPPSNSRSCLSGTDPLWPTAA